MANDPCSMLQTIQKENCWGLYIREKCSIMCNAAPVTISAGYHLPHVFFLPFLLLDLFTLAVCNLDNL